MASMVNSTLESTSAMHHPIFNILLAGTAIVQGVLGRPGVAVNGRAAKCARSDASNFLQNEVPIALDKLLCNIGSKGCASSGAFPGVVIASPSTEDPNCKSCTLLDTWQIGFGS